MKKKVIYNLLQLDRIGQVADEIFCLRNLFDESSHEIHINLYPPELVPKINMPFFEIATRGLHLKESENIEELKRHHGKSEGIHDEDGVVCVTTPPFNLKLLTIMKLLKQKPCYQFRLSEKELERGWLMRNKMGIPADAKFVTLHVRDGRFAPKLTHHNFRNANISQYLKAVEFLISQGYHVIRLGDSKMLRFDSPPEQLIDAPFHPEYEHFFEPYFISQSDFYLGQTSGPASIALGFGVPVLYTDTPIHQVGWNQAADMFVYKKAFSDNHGRPLSYEEIITSPMCSYYLNSEFEEDGVAMIDNTPDEILTATKDMLDKINGKATSDQSFIEARAHIRQIQEKANEYAKSKGLIFNSYQQEFNISPSFITLNRSFFGL